MKQYIELFLLFAIRMQTLKQLQNGELKGVSKFKLSEKISTFPIEIFDLADTLETLDLSHNNLSALPADFGRLHKLKILFCSENQFKVLPEVLADCPLLDIVGFKSNQIETVPPASVNPNIRWLILTNNRVEELPAEIGFCNRLQKVMLAGNRLKQLPPELSNCSNLELLRISANQLTELPEWLLTMPQLAWLAFSGNPFCIKPTITPLRDINWSEFEISHLLGEGASGIISQANWTNGNDPRQVAIKLFKGAVTSDGLPEDEMNACITAGLHAGLVQIIGQIAGHPEGKKGLVMELIPQRFYNLGLPPSFESCTRDVFTDGISLSAEQVLTIASTVASVARQLHSKGIMHSDLYAHNTLIDDKGNTLFGDFGAACFYNKVDKETADALERIEVRAYGCLLDDLLGLCDEALPKLSKLRDACLLADASSRPNFTYIANGLL
jgi:hypothetical protein